MPGSYGLINGANKAAPVNLGKIKRRVNLCLTACVQSSICYDYLKKIKGMMLQRMLMHLLCNVNQQFL